MITKIKSKRNIMIILIVMILITISFVCFGELGTNKGIPKRAIYVNILI